MAQESISLILPMYNESEYIEKTINAAKSVFESITQDFEIIIVDDASNDGSEETADILSQSDKRIKVIHHTHNRKLGGVLKTGFSSASKEIVIYTDMDMPFDFHVLNKFIPLMNKADIINGYRTAYNDSFKRSLYSKVYNHLIRSLFGLKVKDVNFAMKIFKKNVFNEIQLRSEGSFISAEVLIKAQYLGYMLYEVPVDYKPRHWGRSRLSSVSVILKVIYEMIKFLPAISILRIKSRYKHIRNKAHIFIRRSTCPFQLLERYIPEEGDIYDLGCGFGLFLQSLSQNTNEKRRFYGFDIDASKIRFADTMNKGNRMSFKVQDITEELQVFNAACIILIDTLMLMPFKEQEKLLTRCFDYLSEKGVVIIKEIDTFPRWKYLWHQFQETLVLKVFRLIRGKGLYIRPRKDFLSLLEKTGYKVKVIDLHRGYLYPHILYICNK